MNARDLSKWGVGNESNLYTIFAKEKLTHRERQLVKSVK